MEINLYKEEERVYYKFLLLADLLSFYSIPRAEFSFLVEVLLERCKFNKINLYYTRRMFANVP